MPPSISFSGGSWIGLCYYLGAVSYLLTIVPEDIQSLGTSAGSWAALALQLKGRLDINDIKLKLYTLMDDVGKFPYNVEGKIRKLFDHLFTFDPSTVPGVQNNLHVSVTRIRLFGFKNEMLHGFRTKKSVQDALVQSSRLPLLVGTDWTIDGGLTKNQPVIDANTVKVNCITGLLGADIFPSKPINLLNVLVPPSLRKREKIYMMGLEDTRSFFEQRLAKEGSYFPE